MLGQDPADADRAWRSRIGIVLQSSADNAELTVAELVHHFAGFYPDPRDADEVISWVGLEEQRRTRTRALSGGQRRRLDVALGVIGDPELLFLDEPTTGFDPEARRQFWSLITALRAGGTTILLDDPLPGGGRAAGGPGRRHQLRAAASRSPHPPSSVAERDRAATVVWTEAGRRREVVTDAPTAVVTDLAARFAPARCRACRCCGPRWRTSTCR